MQHAGDTAFSTIIRLPSIAYFNSIAAHTTAELATENQIRDVKQFLLFYSVLERENTVVCSWDYVKKISPSNDLFDSDKNQLSLIISKKQSHRKDPFGKFIVEKHLSG